MVQSEMPGKGQMRPHYAGGRGSTQSNLFTAVLINTLPATEIVSVALERNDNERLRSMNTWIY